MEKLDPFLKWAGGKRGLLLEIRNYVPESFNRYYEPFIGAGALLFDLQPQIALINDLNPEIINCYKVIQNNVDELITDLMGHVDDYEYFLWIRNLDRTDLYKDLSSVKKASRTIYLNKTCYNGLYRVNAFGQFNVPYASKRKREILNKNLLKKINLFLASKKVSIINEDFERAVENADYGDFIYFDPPYDPVTSTSNFTKYTSNAFNKNDHLRLKKTFDVLNQKGCKNLLSSSSTLFIKNLYKEYKIMEVTSPRYINSNPSKRGKVPELLIMNY